MPLTEDLNILELKPLVSPVELKKKLPVDETRARIIVEGRRAVERILRGDDTRMIAIVGPCSLHDEAATCEYADRLGRLSGELSDKLLVTMRAYFEKPRTSIGWKGMLYDPGLDDSDDIWEGVHRSRRLLLEITGRGLPAATEILDPIVPQFLCDLISWAAIGARTTESQIHRQMASGLSMPIGFKNATDGNLTVAIEAIQAAANPHAFLGIDRTGKAAIASTRGNKYGHLVLRGGTHAPNYGPEYVAFAEVLLRKSGIGAGIIIDCSHANSYKNPKLQRKALAEVIAQRREGNQSIKGVMLESFLKEGRQSIHPKSGKLEYGLSITDACIGWEETEELLRKLAEAV